MIFEIAIGIVIAVLVLKFLPEILGLGVIAVSAALVIGCSLLALVLFINDWGLVVEGLLWLIGIFLAAHVIALFGVIVEPVPFFSRDGKADRKALSEIPERGFGKYYIFLLQRLTLGFTNALVWLLVFGISYGLLTALLGEDTTYAPIASILISLAVFFVPALWYWNNRSRASSP